jgi:hypothetical protein
LAASTLFYLRNALPISWGIAIGNALRILLTEMANGCNFATGAAIAMVHSCRADVNE